MKSSLTRTRWAAIGAAVAVTFGGGIVMVANAAVSGTKSDTFVPLTTPCRLLDTRSTNLSLKTEATGISSGVLKNKSSVDNDVTVIFDSSAISSDSTYVYTYRAGSLGSYTYRPILGKCEGLFKVGGDLWDTSLNAGSGGPVQPVALLLNVTAVNMTANGFVTVYPWQLLNTDRSNRPAYSNLNTVGGGFPTVSNNATVRLVDITETTYLPNVRCGGTGDPHGNSDCKDLSAFRVFNENGETHIVIDVLGVYLT